MKQSSLEVMNKYTCLSHFVLKIIAVVLMTIDHVALFFVNQSTPLYVVMRCLGRLSFPLFAFMSIQGVRKSRNPYKYALRLLAVGILIDIGLMIYDYSSFEGNSMTELGLGVIIFALINEKNWKSFLSIFPITLIILSEFAFFPLKFEFATYGLLIMAGFYLANIGVDLYLKIVSANTAIDYSYLESTISRPYKNIASALALIIVNVLMYLLYRVDYESVLLPIMFAYSQWSMFAGVFILFYSGKKGYSNPYVNDAFYLYYPLHILIFELIFNFIV